MPDKQTLRPWVEQALRDLGGKASIVAVCRRVWEEHEAELRASGDLFFTWQYDIRWAAYDLRRDGVLTEEALSPRGVWELSSPASRSKR